MREWEREGMGIKLLLGKEIHGNAFIYYYRNGNMVMGMGGNGIEKVIPADLYIRPTTVM